MPSMMAIPMNAPTRPMMLFSAIAFHLIIWVCWNFIYKIKSVVYCCILKSLSLVWFPFVLFQEDIFLSHHSILDHDP